MAKKTQENFAAILEAMQRDIWYKVSDFENIVPLKASRIRKLLSMMVEQDILESTGSTKGKRYRKK